ncbi:uncharacterized protein LOC124128722 [Haliotis rufescens]|uniref:uncharacterized protein LOC124128722 n=1 Tax=Haliotis rufescens TaxID=6454 RepID=UPI00201FAC99|nr:uncharacterized protein LOC124128722 [Haliotis rufescens]
MAYSRGRIMSTIEKMSHLFGGNLKKRHLLMIPILVLFLIYIYLSWTSVKQDLSVEMLSRNWSLHGNKITSSDETKEVLRYFKQTGYLPNFLLTAYASENRPQKGRLNILLNTMDGLYEYLKCCILTRNRTLLRTWAIEVYRYGGRAHFHPTKYSCSIPIDTDVVKVSLTISTCSHDVFDYVPVKKPVQLRNGLAICGKTLFGKELKPRRLVEGIEIQKLLGVDKILIFDLDNPDSIRIVFQHYIKQGFLEVQPFELPGRIKGASFRDLYKHRHDHDDQFENDDNFPLLDCRERLSGYRWVMGIDVDEIVLPRKNMSLKAFIKDLVAKHTLAAGFHFYMMFHYTSFGKTRNHSSGIEHFEYSRSTPPQWKAYKYIYIPHRVDSPITHLVDPRRPFTVPRVSPDDGVIHHIRICEHRENDCFPPGSANDESLLRFEADLPSKVQKVMKQITQLRRSGLKGRGPKWTLVS